ncbi:MAG: flagellar export protein FliJ [Spirochaetales bacterium]|nr:flagellar export protein FliJ [Spirochaetales bacterium]
MSKFHFKLENLLKLRERRENEKKIRLGEITSRCSRLRTAMEENDEKSRVVLGERSAGLLTYDYLTGSELFIKRMQEENRRLQKEREDLEPQRLAAQEEYIRASRDRKVIQKLKEKREQEFRKEQNKKEEAERLDITSGLFIRNLSSSRGAEVFQGVSESPGESSLPRQA